MSSADQNAWPEAYHQARTSAAERRQELEESFRFNHKASFGAPGISMQTQMLHLLDPQHLFFTHAGTLFGLKLGDIVEFEDEGENPHIVFQVKGQGRTAQTKVKIWSPFDVEVHISEPNKDIDTHIMFSANVRDRKTTELNADIYTNSRLIGMVLDPMSKITFWEDGPYFRAYEKRIDKVYDGADKRIEESPFMALFRHYREHFADTMKEIVDKIHDALPECPMHHKDQEAEEVQINRGWFNRRREQKERLSFYPQPRNPGI